jgi:hypothetical protein
MARSLKYDLGNASHHAESECVLENLTADFVKLIMPLGDVAILLRHIIVKTAATPIEARHRCRKAVQSILVKTVLLKFMSAGGQVLDAPQPPALWILTKNLHESREALDKTVQLLCAINGCHASWYRHCAFSGLNRSGNASFSRSKASRDSEPVQHARREHQQRTDDDHDQLVSPLLVTLATAIVLAPDDKITVQ